MPKAAFIDFTAPKDSIFFLFWSMDRQAWVITRKSLFSDTKFSMV